MAILCFRKWQMFTIVAITISVSEASNLTLADCKGSKVATCQTATDPPVACAEKYVETVQGAEGIQCGAFGSADCVATGPDGCSGANCFCKPGGGGLATVVKETKGYVCKGTDAWDDTNSDSQKYTLTVPAGISQIKAYLIGASGGENRGGQGWSGAGGYTEGQFEVTPGQLLSIAVGHGGQKHGEGSGGGGYSGVFSGNSMTQATAILIAGGGGGGACCGSENRGGAGGGEKGQDAQGGNAQAKGGSQTAGGAGESNGGAGQALKGGNARANNVKGGWPGGGRGDSAPHPGAGGGGGYWGGGGGEVGGSNGADAGGGGSGYIGGSSANKVLEANYYTGNFNELPQVAKPDDLQRKAQTANEAPPPNNVGQGWGTGTPLGTGGKSCGYILLEMF